MEENKPKKKHRPNKISLLERILLISGAAFLFLYGTAGLIKGDIFIFMSKRRRLWRNYSNEYSDHHFYGNATIFAYLAILCICICLISVVVDHFDKRDNERSYKLFARGSIIAAAIFLGMASIENKQEPKYKEEKHEWEYTHSKGLGDTLHNAIVSTSKTTYKTSETIKISYSSTKEVDLRSDRNCDKNIKPLPLPAIFKKANEEFVLWDNSPLSGTCGSMDVRVKDVKDVTVKINEPGIYKVAFKQLYVNDTEAKYWYSEPFTVQ